MGSFQKAFEDCFGDFRQQLMDEYDTITTFYKREMTMKYKERKEKGKDEIKHMKKKVLKELKEKKKELKKTKEAQRDTFTHFFKSTKCAK